MTMKYKFLRFRIYKIKVNRGDRWEITLIARFYFVYCDTSEPKEPEF